VPVDVSKRKNEEIRELGDDKDDEGNVCVATRHVHDNRRL
jgi:hypothetical protein